MPLPRHHRVPRHVLLALAFGLALSGIAGYAIAAERPELRQTGNPVFGAAGITRTTGDIMLEQASRAGEPDVPVLNNEHELERIGLKTNPESPRIASIPQMPADQLTYRPKGFQNQLLSPQVVGVNVLAATLATGAGVPTTGSFPPDNNGAVGPTQFVVAVNGRILTLNKTTGAADGVLNATMNTFFTSVRNGSGTSDPMVRYDRLTARWFVTIINVSTPNRWMLAVTDAASNGVISATTVWTYYQFTPPTIAPAISNGNTCLSDYPSLGIDNNALYFGVSEFCGSPQVFQQTDLFVVRKSSVLSGGPIVVTPFRAVMSSAGGYVGPFSARGVDNYDPTANEGYFMGVDGASYGLLWFDRIADPGGTPSLTQQSVTIPVTNQALTVPHLGNTGGTNGNLDPLDDRLFAVHIRNHRLWTSQNIKVDNTGVVNATDANNTRNASRWYEFDVPVGGAAPTIVQSGTVFTQTANNLTTERHYWVPSIMVSGQNHAAMGFSTAGTNERVNAATVGRLSGDPLGTMQTPVLLTASSTAYNPAGDNGASRGSRRWGDYTITALDPLDDQTMWTIQQYTAAANNYGCRVAQLKAPPPATPSALPDITAGQSTVNVTLTGVAAGGSGFFDPGANLAAPARPYNHLAAAITTGGATGTPPTVVSATYVNPTTVNLVLNASAATANVGSEKYTITITNPDGQTSAAAVVHVVQTTYTINASAGANGSISPNGAVTVNAGANQSFTITPAACYSIADVLVDGVSVGAVASYTFTNVQANHTISASFAFNTYTIVSSAGANGSISPNGSTVVNCGASQAYTITPAGGYQIADVVVDGSSVGAVASYTFTNVQANHTISASFAATFWTISASAGAGGSISPNGNVSVGDGGSQAFTITADPCYSIADVLVDGSSVGAVGSYTFTNVQANHTIAASFTLNTYTIAASAGTGGGISPAGNVTVNCGADQTFAIAADPCYTIADVLVDGSSVGAVASYTFTNVQAGHTIAASFTLTSYTITASAGGGGAISPSGAVAVNCGASQTFTITADPCYSIADVLVDGSSVGAVASYTFTNVQGNHTIAASFALDSHTIVASAGAGGTITPNGSVSVNCGADQTFAIDADGCHQVADVVVDGGSVGAVGSYTFTNVQANHTISATFAPVAAAVSPVSNVVSTQLKTGNDTDGTTKIRITFAAPPSTTAEVWRRGFGGYPQYDGAGGAAPAVPGAYPPAGWTLTGVTTSGGFDEPATRDAWYYVAYAKDACGNVSPVSNLAGGTLDYHLGDVSDGATPGQGDNQVSTVDVSLLGTHYGLSGAGLAGFEYLDIGPTTDNSTNGRPTTDGNTDFEDLVLFSINFTPRVSLVVKGGAVASAIDQLSLAAPAEVAAGEEFDVPVLLAGAGDLQALSTKLGWNSGVVEAIGVAAGDVIESQGGIVLSPRAGTVDAALLGAGSGMGSGTVAIVRFRALASGAPRISIVDVIGRDEANQPVTVTVAQPLAVPSVARMTDLQSVIPNPTRGGANVVYALAKGGAVDLSIYSVDGRHVKTLARGVQAEGRHSAHWDGTDERGQALRSGVYFVRLEAAGARRTRLLTKVE